MYFVNRSSSSCFLAFTTMSRYLVARSSLWYKTGVISRSFSFTRVPLRHDRGYRRSQYNKGPRQLHRRVINDSVLQEQMDIMRLSIADLETGDRFGSLSSDCDVHEQLKGLVEPDQPVPSPARERKKSASLEVSSKTDEHSRLRGYFFDRQVVYDAYQKDVKDPQQPRRPVSKNVNERRISVPVEVSDQTNEHSKLCNKFSGEKSLSDIKPDHKDWSEKFGSLSRDLDKFLDNYVVDSKSVAADKDDDGSEKFIPLSTFRRKHMPNWYGRRIAKFGRAGKVYEALETLEQLMLKKDKVPPNQYVFTVLIGVLGRVGYTEKAFDIFDKMKRYELKPQDPTYTALFNACSNSPWPADALTRISNLRELMASEDYSPNIMTYNAMIKAYACCGDVKSAFAAADEAVAGGHTLGATTYSSLLMACIADKSAGLKLAIEVWRLMRKKRCRPNSIHYNLLLRAVRDCGVGSEEHINELLLPVPQSFTRRQVHFSAVLERKRLPGRRSVQSSKPLETKASSENSRLSTVEADRHLTTPNTSAVIPDLLDPQITVASSVELRLPESAIDRLAMLGGMSGMLARMDCDKAKPDVKTFAMLLELTPLSLDSETDLLSAMRKYTVQPNVDFYNMLIRKRNYRRDYDGACVGVHYDFDC